MSFRSFRGEAYSNKQREETKHLYEFMIIHGVGNEPGDLLWFFSRWFGVLGSMHRLHHTHISLEGVSDELAHSLPSLGEESLSVVPSYSSPRSPSPTIQRLLREVLEVARQRPHHLWEVDVVHVGLLDALQERVQLATPHSTPTVPPRVLRHVRRLLVDQIVPVDVAT